jgi:hypothetical protein
VTEDAARRGTRDNGLRCGSYAPVADVDPRVADALLSALRDEGIAAYAAPAPAVTGGIMEPRLPQSPTDRVWVDDQQVPRAKAVVSAHADEPGVTPPAEPGVVPAGEPDIDAAWQQVLASLQSTSSSPVPPWPVSEDVDAAGTDTRLIRPASLDEDDDDDEQLASDDEHFVPPPPPPLPRLHRKTVAAIAAIVVGLLILATNFDDGTFTVLAVLAILAGLASLVWRMHDGPPTDSGWDDGAVL